MRGKKIRKGKGQVAERYEDKSATDSHHLLCYLLAFMLFQFQSASLSLVLPNREPVPRVRPSGFGIIRILSTSR